MKILTIIGARPTFIKSVAISPFFEEFGIEEKLVHTGQHFDHNMSDIFLSEYKINKIDYNLNISDKNRIIRLTKTIKAIKDIILNELPDFVMVFGDTDSAIAGSMAASVTDARIIHVEAGMRSFEEMPEELNRIIIDHLSHILFCPIIEAIENLSDEGIDSNIYLVGDVMYDIFVRFKNNINDKILNDLRIDKEKYVLVTIHREYNTSKFNKNLELIVEGLLLLLINNFSIVFPIHPRTREALIENNLKKLFSVSPRFKIIDPVGYMDMLSLENNAKVIITDSGGVQKEAAFCGVPCIVLRNNTEWVNLVKSKNAILVGSDPDKIYSATTIYYENELNAKEISIGDGWSGRKIAEALSDMN